MVNEKNRTLPDFHSRIDSKKSKLFMEVHNKENGIPIPYQNATVNGQLKRQLPNCPVVQLPFIQSVFYICLWLLFIFQLVVILNNHSHQGGLTMFDTMLLLIAKADPRILPLKWIFPDETAESASLLRPLLIVIGGIVFLALLFVNFTHALEAISCADSSSHFSTLFIAMVAINLAIKLPLLFCSNRLSLEDIPAVGRLFLHFGPSLTTLALFTANWHFTPGDDFLISHLDRYFGAGLCVLLAVAVFPVFKKNLPYLLCDAPEGVDLDQLKVEIERKFPIRCKHLHIYRRWPDTKSFDVFGHIQLAKNEHFDGDELTSMLANLHKMLKAKGAHQINIQPALANPEESNCNQKLCVSVDCQQTEKSCCDVPLNCKNSSNKNFAA